jgi:tetraacyldisaccharide 4'-kinase
MGHNRSIFLYPLSLLYGLITAVRNFLFNTNIIKSHEFQIPVICVGNLAVGGTGKTPHTEYLAGLLRKDFKVAVLSRGYKRKTRGFLFADNNSKVSDIGDEPLQIYRKFPDVTVAVDRNRVHGVNIILEKKPDIAVIILDDAYQHRRITPGYSILLSDFGRLMIKDHMLPYGNLREGFRNMNRADIILITKSPENISPIQRRIIVKDVSKAPYQNLYFTSFTYLKPVPVFDDCIELASVPPIPADENEYGIVLVTGIANPQPLLEYLGKTVKEIVHLPFRDHRTFTVKDIDNIVQAWNDLKSSLKYIFTTEKDAVRLREFSNIAQPVRSSFYYIPVGICFLNDDKDEFDKLIVDYVRKNKRNNRIS